MGLFRLLFWILVIIAVIWLWRRLTRPASPPAAKSGAEPPKPMVRCAHCGIHLPREEALAEDSLWYCSQAHLTQGPRHGGR
ncbi:PP0621 family protein [Azotobacter salinestris]|uniref:PP0621 family protein n=1 Tax=Azotobacter salinestris TaxID=69964 RepID=UPI001266D239|nr:PP0621 family protein [Azotobacter salinestris]